jgi:hypothetical protein
MTDIDTLIHQAVRGLMKRRNISFIEACHIVYTRVDVLQSHSKKASAL